MKIAISSKGSAPESEVDPRFGRASYLLVFDAESGAWNAVDNTEAQALADAAGIRAAEIVCRAGARIVISGDLGPKALAALVPGRVHAYRCGATTARGAMEAFRRGELAEL